MNMIKMIVALLLVGFSLCGNVNPDGPRSRTAPAVFFFFFEQPNIVDVRYDSVAAEWRDDRLFISFTHTLNVPLGKTVRASINGIRFEAQGVELRAARGWEHQSTICYSRVEPGTYINQLHVSYRPVTVSDSLTLRIIDHGVRADNAALPDVTCDVPGIQD